MTPLLCLRIAALLGALAVALGAFGAHGLKERISPEMLTVFEVGVRYHFYHVLALLGLALAPAAAWDAPLVPYTAWAWGVGILIFSGSLYVLAITGITKFGMITPIGGVAFIAGWVMLLLSARRIVE
ncbi:MAG: DUF423 domain-containing protein [Candidatus Hydrogenedentes bacterium]|nr:DUF423 domain-containing protein [Candidatus Hydrogenedentota bacterium]